MYTALEERITITVIFLKYLQVRMCVETMIKYQTFAQKSVCQVFFHLLFHQYLVLYHLQAVTVEPVKG